MLQHLKWHILYRYVYEWLSGMVAAGIIHQDTTTRLYTVPSGHTQGLQDNSPFAPILVTSAKRMELIRKCFQADGPWGK